MPHGRFGLASREPMGEVVEALGLGVAVFQTGQSLLTSGDFSSEATTVNYIHERTPPSQLFRSCATEFSLLAHHPRYGFGTQTFWFRLTFDYNGNDLRNIAIVALVHRSSSLYSSTFSVRFVGQAHSVPSAPVAEVMFQISGRWNPVGRGDVSFWGNLRVRADGTTQLSINSEQNWVRAGVQPGMCARVAPRDLSNGVQGLGYYDSVPCIYGRWCGPGCSGPGAPVDDVDACCLAHDHCYSRRGYFDCECNEEVLRCVAPKRDWRTPKGRAAWAVWSAFRALPCRR